MVLVNTIRDFLLPNMSSSKFVEISSFCKQDIMIAKEKTLDLTYRNSDLFYFS